jgi:hypothetical protein
LAAALATLAFLVVFKVLIKLFFSMDIFPLAPDFKFLSPADAGHWCRRDAKLAAAKRKDSCSENKPLSTKVPLTGELTRLKKSPLTVKN